MPSCGCDIWRSLDEGTTTHCHYQPTATTSVVATFPQGTRGRFIRIRRRDSDILTVCEVEVFTDITGKTGKILCKNGCRIDAYIS